jgi:hypothetical protein
VARRSADECRALTLSDERAVVARSHAALESQSLAYHRVAVVFAIVADLRADLRSACRPSPRAPRKPTATDAVARAEPKPSRPSLLGGQSATTVPAVQLSAIPGRRSCFRTPGRGAQARAAAVGARARVRGDTLVPTTAGTSHAAETKRSHR